MQQGKPLRRWTIEPAKPPAQLPEPRPELDRAPAQPVPVKAHG